MSIFKWTSFPRSEHCFLGDVRVAMVETGLNGQSVGVSLLRGGYHAKDFKTPEEARAWCEADAREFIEKLYSGIHGDTK